MINFLWRFQFHSFLSSSSSFLIPFGFSFCIFYKSCDWMKQPEKTFYVLRFIVDNSMAWTGPTVLELYLFSFVDFHNFPVKISFPLPVYIEKQNELHSSFQRVEISSIFRHRNSLPMCVNVPFGQQLQLHLICFACEKNQ